jgi:hypothetical protein
MFDAPRGYWTKLVGTDDQPGFKLNFPDHFLIIAHSFGLGGHPKAEAL